MERLKIKSYEGNPSPGDFKAIVSGNALLLPECIAIEMIRLGVRTPEDLLSAITGPPSWLCQMLGWTPADVAKADVMLRRQLKGLIDPRYLKEEKRGHPRVELGYRLRPPSI